MTTSISLRSLFLRNVKNFREHFPMRTIISNDSPLMSTNVFQGNVYLFGVAAMVAQSGFSAAFDLLESKDLDSSMISQMKASLVITLSR